MKHLIFMAMIAGITGLSGTVIVVDKNGGGEHTTIAAAEAVMTPGDTVLVKDGQYDEDVIVNVNGTESARVVLKAEHKHGARLKRFMLIADYITIDGFELTGTAGAGVTNAKSHNRIINNHIHDIPNVAVQAGTYGYVAHNLMERVVLGVKLASHSVAEYNRVVQLTELKVAGVFNGFTYFLGDSITIRYNYFWNDTLIGDFFRTWDEGGAGPSHDCLMEGNVCFNAMHASEPTATAEKATSGLTYQNNLFVNTYYVGVCTKYCRETRVLHNTFINCGAYPVWFQDSPATGNEVKNNLFAYYGNPLLGSGKDRGVRSDGDYPPDCDYNMYFNTQMYRDPGDHESIVVPRFVSPTPDDTLTADFHMQSDSPTLDAGVDLGVPADLEGASRMEGDAPDIGCYEYHTLGIEADGKTPRTGLRISPLPVKDILIVNSSENLDMTMVLDMSGRPVWQKMIAGSSVRLNIEEAGLKPGHYFLLAGAHNHLSRFIIAE